jgi:hypothetical protein
MNVSSARHGFLEAMAATCATGAANDGSLSTRPGGGATGPAGLTVKSCSPLQDKNRVTNVTRILKVEALS